MPTIKLTGALVARALFFSLLLCSVVGCGDGRPSRVKVSGTVTVDGTPLKQGFLQFKPVDGGRFGGGTIVDGHYSITMFDQDDGLPLGDFNVLVTASQTVSEFKVRWLAPKRYSIPGKSGLTVTVTEETEAMDLELSWKDSQSGHSAPWVEDMR